MTDFSKFGFDPEAMKKLLESTDFTKMFEGVNPAGLDPKALWEAQQKNLDALVAANRSAAEGMQAAFAQQLAMMEEALADTRKQMSALNASALDPQRATEQSQLAKASFDRTLAQMGALAETAQTASGEAFEQVSSRIREAMEELRNAMESPPK